MRTDSSAASRQPTPRSLGRATNRRTLRLAGLLAVSLLVGRNVAAQSTSQIAWDEDPNSVVAGYAITVDGVRTDYGLSPLNSSGACGCAIALPFSGGQHAVIVSAYNVLGETVATALVVAPVANAGGPYSGVAETAVVVDASRSGNPAGAITLYAWNWGDGSSGATSSPIAAHTYGSAGTYGISLIVTDNGGASATAATSATVAPVPHGIPTVSLTTPLNASTFGAPAAIAVAASAGAKGATVARVDFYANSSLIATTGSPYTTTWGNVPAGTYSLQAVVTDSLGATATSAAVGITVKANTTPVAKNDKITTTRNHSVTIPVLQNDYDPDGDPLTIATVNTPDHGWLLVNRTSMVYTAEADYTGVVTFTYAISDGRGGVSMASVTVTVNK